MERKLTTLLLKVRVLGEVKSEIGLDDDRADISHHHVHVRTREIPVSFVERGRHVMWRDIHVLVGASRRPPLLLARPTKTMFVDVLGTFVVPVALLIALPTKTMFVDVLATVLMAVLYFLLRPRRLAAMVLNGMVVHFPATIDKKLIANFTPLLEWQTNICKGLVANGASISKVVVRDAYMFGPRIGFLLLDVEVEMFGVLLPGAVLLRGRSVAVLLWYRHPDDGVLHVVLVRQPRVAIGVMSWEVPAGMADGSGLLKGQMFKEIEEETGLSLNVNDLEHHANDNPHTSCGLLDERLELYSMEISPHVIKTSDQIRGNFDQGEIITNVEAVPVHDARVRNDGKLRVLLSIVST